MRLYRKAAFGRLAEFFVLDTRQYRTDQPNGDGVKPLNESALSPANTLLGARQRGWLQAGLLASTAVWNVLAQQVMMGLVDREAGGRQARAIVMAPKLAKLTGTVALSRNAPGSPSKVGALLHGRAPRRGRITRPCL